MVGPDDPARHTVGEHRDPQPLGEGAQFVLGVPPPDVRPGHDHRALGTCEQVDGPLKRNAVGGGGGYRLGQRPGATPVGDFTEDVVHREVDETHPRRCSDSGAQCVVDAVAGSGGRLGGGRVSAQRRHERHMVDFLQRTHPPPQSRRPTTE